MNYNRFIPIITAATLYFLGQMILTNPRLFYVILSFGVLIIALSIFLISRSRKDIWPAYVIAPILLFLSLTAYISILTNRFWIQLGWLILPWFIFFYLRSLYYHARNSKTQDWVLKIDNLFISGSFLAVFCTAGFLFGLPVFISIPWYVTAFVSTLVVSLSLVQFKALSDQYQLLDYPLILINALLCFEITAALVMLPLNYHILALFLAIIYYFSLTVIRLYSRGSLNRHSLKIPLIFSIIAFILLFLTSRWL